MFGPEFDGWWVGLGPNLLALGLAFDELAGALLTTTRDAEPAAVLLSAELLQCWPDASKVVGGGFTLRLRRAVAGFVGFCFCLGPVVPSAPEPRGWSLKFDHPG